MVSQVEVNVSILWEDVQDGPDQIRARQDVLECASMVIRQVEIWTAATESTN